MGTFGESEEQTVSAHTANPGAEIAEKSTEPFTAQELKNYFEQTLGRPLEVVEEIEPADIVVGIPFYDEDDTIASVVQTIREGLEEFYPGQKSVIAAVGSPAGSEWWMQDEAVAEMPLMHQMAIFGTRRLHRPGTVQVELQELLLKYQRGFNSFHRLFIPPLYPTIHIGKWKH